MKKIEREPVPDEKGDLYLPDMFCVVKIKDLDELEQQRDEAVELLQFVYDNIENVYVVESAITNYLIKAGKK